MNKFQSHYPSRTRYIDLLEAVKDINTQTLYSVQTKLPEIYKKISNEMIHVVVEKKYNLIK